jgi:hypothetical protein
MSLNDKELIMKAVREGAFSIDEIIEDTGLATEVTEKVHRILHELIKDGRVQLRSRTSAPGCPVCTGSVSFFTPVSLSSS